MRTIHKFENQAKINLKKGMYKVILAGVQNGSYRFWIEYDTNHKADHFVSFKTYPTGAEIPVGSKHEYSFIDGPFVWHLYSSAVPI